MRQIMILNMFAVALVAFEPRADQFSDLWYDGNAELSTYEITEMRYGEPRKGSRVMVFVTEPMRLSTHIKPDVKLPP
ncbi:MAG: hypothetical protein GF410_16955, partial [Chitinivibrionales bacterium]|nr:hypothetical protein [Chitinivibrionales bacterium]